MNVHPITYLVASNLSFDTGTLGLKEEVKFNFITRNRHLFAEASNDVINVIWSLEVGEIFQKLTMLQADKYVYICLEL